MFGLKKKVKEQIIIHIYLEYPGESLCDMKDPPKHRLNEFHWACQEGKKIRKGMVCPQCLSILINTLPEDDKDEMIDRMAYLQKKGKKMLRGITVETIRGSQITVQDSEVIVRTKSQPSDNLSDPSIYDLEDINFMYIDMALTSYNEHRIRLYYSHSFPAVINFVNLGRYDDPLVAALLCANIMQAVKEVKLTKGRKMKMRKLVDWLLFFLVSGVYMYFILFIWLE